MNRKDTVASRVDWRRKKKGHRRSRTIHMIHTHTKKIKSEKFHAQRCRKYTLYSDNLIGYSSTDLKLQFTLFLCLFERKPLSTSLNVVK